jgi:DNA-binding SARP family transcriptional activator
MKAYLFGPLRLVDANGRSAPLPPTADGRALLAYLLLHADQPRGRSHLAALIKPDDSEEKARRALSQALWQVRRALPDGAVVASGDTITLHGAAVARDTAQFDDSLTAVLTLEAISAEQAAPIAAALALYTADLLSDSYDDWVLLPREQRRERYLRGLELLAAWEKGNGRYPAALDYMLKLTQADPLREAAQREAMRLYVALDRPQAALRHYEQFCRYLDEEMAVPPDPSTVRLAQAIAAAAPVERETAVYLPAAPPSVAYALSKTAQMPLVGRDGERGQLVEQLAWLNNGQGGLIFVSGPPGIGKSRLLEELARDAEWRGVGVSWGYGRELDVVPAYALFSEALSGLLTPLRWRQLAELIDTFWLEQAGAILNSQQSAVSGEKLKVESEQLVERDAPFPLRSMPGQAQLPEAVGRLLAGLAQLRPLLLIFDDAQWADLASLETLVHIGRRLREMPVLILLAFRDEEARADTAVWDNLNALDAAGLRLRLTLSSLDEAATMELINRGLGLRRDAPLFSRRLFTETGGSPLLLLESLRALHDEGSLYRDERGEWHTPFDNQTADYAELPVGPQAAALTARRLRQLPAEARRTLETAAVIGKDVPFELLAAAAAQSRPALFAALGLLAQRQFLLETAESYRFSHDKVRAAVYQSILPERRIQLHRRTAAVLAAQTPTAVDRIAYHYRQGEQWPEALQFTLQAAERARALSAIAAALEDYALALQILDDCAPLPLPEAAEARAQILIARQKFLRMSGQIDQQQQDLAVLRQLAGRLSNPLWQADALLREADFISEIKAEHDAAVALAEQALALAQANGLPRREAEAWQTIGHCRYTQGRYQEGGVALRRAVALWESLPNANAELMSAYLQLIYNERMSGRRQEGLALVHKLLALAESDGNLLGQGSAYSVRGSFYDDQGDHLASIEAYAQARAIFQRIGARINEARALANIGYGYWCLHQYGQAIALTEESLAIFQALETQKSILLSYLNLSELYYDVGQLERGGDYTAVGVALARQLKLTNYELACLVGRAQALARRGAAAAAERVH